MELTQWYLFLTSFLTNIVLAKDMSRWDSWWSYEGLSGPEFWGLLNIDWVLCSRGRNQSPINIDPKTLLFDPSLGPIVIEGDRISGYLHNNGHDITLKVSNTTAVNITEGPLSYKYRIQQIRIHFHVEDYLGSEHTIDGRSFPAEECCLMATAYDCRSTTIDLETGPFQIDLSATTVLRNGNVAALNLTLVQIIGYNTDLYSNISVAERSPRGLTIIALFLQIAESPHSEFGVLLKAVNKTKYKGDVTRVRDLQFSRLLPSVDHYVTYEGSVTHPGCFETATWLILNKPIHVSKSQIDTLRELNQATIENPQMLMAPNIRPEMPLNQRTVRTNINFRSRSCSMGKDMFYKVNERFKEP